MRADRVDICLAGVIALVTAYPIGLSASGAEETAVLLVGAGLVFVVLLVGLWWFLWRDFIDRSCLPPVLVTVAACLLIASVIVTQWPVRTAYSLSQSSFNQVANRIRNYEDIKTPARIGLFAIQKAELNGNGIVCLWTETSDGGNTGFILCDKGNVPFNLWSIVHLDGRWKFISED